MKKLGGEGKTKNKRGGGSTVNTAEGERREEKKKRRISRGRWIRSDSAGFLPFLRLFRGHPPSPPPSLALNFRLSARSTPSLPLVCVCKCECLFCCEWSDGEGTAGGGVMVCTEEESNYDNDDDEDVSEAMTMIVFTVQATLPSRHSLSSHYNCT